MSTHIALHHETSGTGRPLILLHGLFGSLSNWRPLAREWGEELQVYSVDLRNHGQSPHSDEFNYQIMAHDLCVWMKNHNHKSASLLGHSLGGKVAMQFALNFPDMVEKLIVADMTPRATRPRHEHILAALQALDLSSARSRRELDAQLAAQIPDGEVRQFLLMNIRHDASGALCWRMNLDALARNYNEVNRAVEAKQPFDRPALFVRGEKSDYIGEDDCAAIKQLFPFAQIETIANAGHWVHAEAPQEFSRLVLNFLDN
jgi:esterase